ncbi:MAG: glycosyltransferase [Candidatus Magasanikbacteria bacterium]|nr:glycosyltransferase [Candidatus Magasanikbacteria bacterium]
MKILLVNKYWYLRGGAERVVFATKELLERAGHAVEIFGLRHPDNIVTRDYFVDGGDYEHGRGLALLRAGWQSVYNREAKRAFARCVADFKPDVVHFHNIYHQLSFSLLDVVRASRLPAVMTLHDYKMISPNYTLYHHGQIREESVGGKYYRCLTQNALERVAASGAAMVEAYVRAWRGWRHDIRVYISPSDFLREKFIAAGWSGDRIVVLRNPIDAVRYPVTVGDEGYVAYIGRLSQEKGAEVFLRAAAQTPEIQYMVVGDGPLLPALRRLASANVHFVGWQTGADLERLANDARLIVAPSLWYENYPYSILEAKARAKIVLASDIGGIPELLPSNFLVPPGDADAFAERVKYFYNLPAAERQRRGAVLRREVAEVNDPAKYLDGLLRVYEAASQDIF